MLRIMKWAEAGLAAGCSFLYPKNRLQAPALVLLLIIVTLNGPAYANPVSYELLAHRGLHQTFSPVGLQKDTCTAARIHPPRHHYIENTLASIQAALDLGADIIEFDVHPTLDGEFVVFHDWRLECRTDGKGVVREQTLAYLKKRDIGFGYTADGGETYPFRGKYVGAMPTLAEVLVAFPDVRFLVNIKSNSKEEAELLTAYFNTTPGANRKRLSVYGSADSVEYFAELNQDIMTLSKPKAKSCVKSYVLLGWTGYVPQSCHNSLIPVPLNYQWLIWGWPHRFEQRLREVGSRSLLIGEKKDGQASSGIDSLHSRKRIPELYQGIVFTNRIDLLGQKSNEQANSELPGRIFVK